MFANMRADFGVKFMVTILYVIQGMFFGYVFSLPLSYRSVPSYYILGLFGTASIPFSFKFILAPIVERYSNLRYGKRKTWIVGTLLLCSIFMYMMADSSEHQNQYYQKMTAFFMFFCVLCVALKDVAADSFAVEVLDSGTISLITFIGDEVGKLITLPLFLNFISSKWMGLQVEELRGVFIKATAIFGIVVVLIIHFCLAENKIKQRSYKMVDTISEKLKTQETDESQISFSQIFSHYKTFLNPSYSLFRFALFLFLINQGMEVVIQTFPVELIKTGIDKQILMFGQNICFVPAAILAYLMCHNMTSKNCYYYYYLATIIRFTYMIGLHFIPIETQNIALTLYIIQCLIGSVHYYLENVCMNQKSKGKFSGLSITLLLSISNFGRLTVFQKMIMSEVGYNRCIIGCFVYTALLLYLIYRVRKWLEEGKSLQLQNSIQKAQ